MKKILLVTQGFPFGNSERGFLETEYDILCSKADVYVLAITELNKNGSDKVIPFQNYKKKKVELLYQLKYKEVWEDIANASKDVSLKTFFKRLKRIVSYSIDADHIKKLMEDIIIRNGIHIVYTYWCLPATVAALRLKNSYDICVISRFHGFDLYKFREPTGWQPLKNYIANKSNLLVFACNEAREYWLHEISNCPEKAIVSYIGTKPSNRILIEKHDTLRVVSCSNNVPLKRVDMIARVINIVSKNVKVEWYHIGGPVEKFLFLEEKKTPYFMYGTVEHSLVKEIYFDIKPDIFITLSTTEGGAPVSIQEAMSMGIPTLGTDVGGISELIEDGINGFLVPKNISEDEVAKIIVEFSNYTLEKRKEFSDNAYRKWENDFNAINNSKEFTETLMNLSL